MNECELYQQFLNLSQVLTNQLTVSAAILIMSWSLFYEEPSSWTGAVADVCSTIVSYGVEIPWCVCQQSWTLFSFVSEYAALVWAVVYSALRLEEWWCTELSIFTSCLALNVPMWFRHSRGDLFVFHSMLSLFLAGMAWMGCFLETASGLQGGVVFGGKLFYPSLALFALAFQGCRMVLINLEKELFGYKTPASDKDNGKVTKAICAFTNFLRCESIFFFALAAFGLPKLEQDTELQPWLCLFPFFALWKSANDYFAAYPPVPQDAAKANGDIAQQQKTAEAPAAAAKNDAKAADAKKPAAEPAKKDDKSKAAAEEKKDDEKKEGEEKKPSAPNPLSRLVGLVTYAVCAVLGAARSAYARVAALPWELITDVSLRLGTVFTATWVFWTLTEDPAVLGVPFFVHFAPLLLDRFVRGRVSKDWEHLLKETCLVAAAGVQYYIFKTNVVQY